MELQIYQVDGNETGRTIALDASVFGIDPNDHVLWLDVRRTQASRRQGTHKAKERGEITGSTRKLYRQKGTGMARAGDVKSPLRRSGGRIFGPRPRNYGLKLTKKTRQMARRSALSYKAQADAIRVVEAFAFPEPSTRQLVDMIEALDLAGQKVLVLTAKVEQALYRSSRNVAKVHVQEARNASAEEVLGAAMLLVEEGAIDVLSRVLAGGASDQASAAEVEAPVAAAPSAEAPAEEASVAEETAMAVDVAAEEDDDEAEAVAADVAAEEAAEAVVAEEDDEAEVVAAEEEVVAEAEETTPDEDAEDAAASDEDEDKA